MAPDLSSPDRMIPDGMPAHWDGGKPATALAVTMGEPAGIGGEIALVAWQQRHEHALLPFFMIDDPQRLDTLAHDLRWEAAVRPIDSPEQAAAVFGEALPVLPLALPAPPSSWASACVSSSATFRSWSASR